MLKSCQKLLISLCIWFSLPVFITSASDAYTYIWREAEAAAAYSPMVVKSDLAASGEIYMAIWGTNIATYVPPQNGRLVFTINVPAQKTYRLWGLTKGMDSFWVQVDNGPWQIWNWFTYYSNWTWDDVAEYGLTAGYHTITFAYRDNGAKLDKIVLSDNLTGHPGTFGAGEQPRLPAPNPFRTTAVVETYGHLQVRGTKLCDQKGNPVRLRGINTHGPQWYPIVPNVTIPNLVETWGIDIVRIAMYVEDYKNGDFWNGYMTDKAKMKARVIQLYDDAIEAGIYVIIDWHIHNNPTYFTAAAMEFFTEMVKRYGGYPNVIFEIANEPEYVDWTLIKSYAETLIPVIRNNDPDAYKNIIIVGSPNWDQDVNEPADNPIAGYSNIMYALHFYASQAHDAIRSKADYALSKNLPMFVTEWGTCDYNVGTNDFTRAADWVNWMDTHYISWINWQLSNRDDASSLLKPGVSIAGPWTDSQLTASGLWIKQRMNTGSIAPVPPQNSVRFVNRNSGKLLDVSAGSTADGGDVIQWTDNGGNNQKWYIVDTGNGYSKIVNANSGKLLDVCAKSITDGGDVIQWTDNGGTNQQWQIVNLGNGYYKIINRNSGKLLDVSEKSISDGGNVIQWADNSGANQQWQIIRN